MFATISGCIKAGSSASGSGGVGYLGGGEEKRLDAMNAVCVYVSAAQLVLQSADQTDSTGASNLGEQRILDLTRLFGQLRQLLSCAVCARLLNDPYAPLNNARCQHNVCRLCVRGRKALRPLCISCKDLQDFKTYVENKTMRCLLLCYKSLCEHLLGSNFYAQLSRQKAHQALTCSGENVFGVAPMPHMTTCGDIIQEGARYEDILNVFSVDLPQITTPILGKVQQTTTQQQQQHQPLATLSAPASAPPLLGTAVGGSSNSASQTAISTPPSLSVVSAVTPLVPLSAPGKRVVHTPSAPRLITPPAHSPASAGVNNSTSLLTTPTPPPPHGTIIKLEPSTNNHLTAGGHSNTHLVMTSKVATLPSQQQPQTQFVYVKNMKCAVSEPQTNQQLQQQQLTSQLHSVQASALNNTNNNGLTTSLSSAPSITYVGNNTPGIVVPIVSSSATTTAPLTIASAKLQSLKRQLAQAQARGGGPISIASAVKAAGLTYTETNTSQQSFKASTSSVPASVGSSSSSSSLTITASGTSTPLLVNSSNITYVNASGASVSTMSNASTTSTATITSQQQQIRNPPSIKTVSNGSAMYSVLYTGVGNKITIKRKTDGDDESGQRKSIASSIAASSTPVPSTPTATTSNQTTTANQQQQQQQQILQQQQVNANKMNAAKRRGCRCGNATPTPGKLTCCGQRCPCYVDSKSCIGCKCRGCRNPHRPDGGKVRPVIPELACYEIQMADENPSLSPGDLQVANTLTTRTHTISASTTTSPIQLTAQQQGAMLVSEQRGTSVATSLSLPSLSSSSSSSSSVTNLSSQIHLASSSSSSPSSKGATLIPFISLHPITSQQNQQQTQTMSSNQQQQQQQQSNMLPLESVLIQNAEGKYQVVNVLTTPQHHQENNSISSSIQRIHSIPQLQISSSTNNNNNSSSSSNNNNTNHTSIVGNMTTVNIITGTTASNAASSSSTIVTSKGAGQSILLTQQQQQHVNRLQQQLQQKSYQQHQIQRLISSDIITTSVNVNTTTTVVSNSTLPMQLQQHQQQHQQHRQQQQQQQQQLHSHHHTPNQQLKSNQIIKVRSTTMQNNKSNNNTSTHQTQQSFTPTLFTSNASHATTITLSPIIMSSSSPNTYKTEIFSDSSESEFMNLATSAGAITTVSSSSSNNNNSLHTNMLSTIYSHSGLVSTPNTPARITSVPSLSSGSTGSASGSTSRMSLGGMSMNLTNAGAHLTPALVEVIETSDL